YSNIIKSNYKFKKAKASKTRIGNIVMFHTGRVGSTVLADLLFQHSDVQWDGEIFIKKEYYSDEFILNPLFFLNLRMYQKKIDFYGFEVTDRQIKNKINQSIDEFFESLENLDFKYFIHLKRKNYLKQYISVVRKRELKLCHIEDNSSISKTIYLNIKNDKFRNNTGNIIENFEKLDQYYDKLEKQILNKKSLFLTYEDDILPNPKIAYNKICDFLNIKNENPVVNLKRTNPFPLKDVIENYNEVESYLKGTKYEWMLYD
ncbi:MAG: hypothetical protein JXR68_14465, partial [Bacteroidales bacterium]|nr:hypothetical protein [Bacteroidales bacterium]